MPKPTYKYEPQEFIQSKFIRMGPKVYTLRQALYYRLKNNFTITEEFHQKDGWYHLVQSPSGEWWLHLEKGFQWDGASGGYPDWDFIMMPSAIHDTLHWLIAHGVIPESENNLIDKELQDAILGSRTKTPLKRFRAWYIRRATNIVKEKRAKGKFQEHKTTKVIMI